MPTEKSDGLDQFRKWLVPLLMTILSALVGIIGADIRTSQVKANNDIEALKLMVANRLTAIEKDVASNAAGEKENKDNTAKLRENLETHISMNADVLYQEARKRLKYKF